MIRSASLRGLGCDTMRLARGCDANASRPCEHASMRSSVVGFTVVEMLVVLALLALALGGVAALIVSRDRAAATAQALVRHVAYTRWSAISTGSSRTLVFVAAPPGITEIDGVFACEAVGLLARRRWTPPRGTLVNWPPMGLAFAPDGRPRRCDGSAVGNTTILVEGPRGDRAAVIVASLGRVRWERR